MEKPKYTKFSLNRSKEEASNIYNLRINDALDIYKRYSNNFTSRKCPICGNDSFHDLEKFYNTYNVAKCNVCSSSYVNPCPSEEALSDYYNNSPCNEAVGALLVTRVRKKGSPVSDKVLEVVQIIENFLIENDSVSILEIACNSGFFLSDLKEELIERNLFDRVTIMGIDVDAGAINNAVDKSIMLKAISAEDFLKNNKKQFDLVIHFELIEHLPDPSKFASEVHSLLNPGGIHYFHTPNGNGFENIAVGYNVERPIAHAVFPPMHLNVFTLENVVHFALRHGFKVENIQTPGKLDVDIVRESEVNIDNEFSFIKDFSEEHLAIVQLWLTKLKASSHMRVTLRK